MVTKRGPISPMCSAQNPEFRPALGKQMPTGTYLLSLLFLVILLLFQGFLDFFLSQLGLQELVCTPAQRNGQQYSKYLVGRQTP